MHIKMHVRTSKLAIKNFGSCIHVPRFNRGRSENGGKGRGREKERRGKGKVEGMTEGRGRKEDMGIRMGRNCATAPRGIDATDHNDWESFRQCFRMTPFQFEE